MEQWPEEADDYKREVNRLSRENASLRTDVTELRKEVCYWQRQLIRTVVSTQKESEKVE